MQPTRVDYPKKKILNVFDFELQPSPVLLPSPARPRFSRHAETRLVQRRSLSRATRRCCLPVVSGSPVIDHKLPVMYFLVCQNVFPFVVALLVILISWYLWRRTSEGPSSNSGEEATSTASGFDKIESPTAEQKVSKVNIHRS